MEKTYLILENGRVFEGFRVGAACDAAGPLTFNTGMVGCVEMLTDPAASGQIVMQTFPLAGNYGIAEEDFEGDCCISGYVAREVCPSPSNFRSEYGLDEFLKKHGVPGICGVDTRELTRIIREEGEMRARISSAPPAASVCIPADTASYSARQEAEFIPADGEQKYSVALIDYGAKQSHIRALTARGCRVTVLPPTCTAEDVLAMAPDGLVLSGGPGDPAEKREQIAQIAQLIGRLPVFGIGLGHQMTALALGGSVTKLPHGHRGANLPVRAPEGGRAIITTQNHVYTVEAASLAGTGVVSFINLNDMSCEGMDYPGRQCFTVQFSPDPRGSDGQFDRFIAMMGGEPNA